MVSISIATFNINYICKGVGDPNAERVATTIYNSGCDIVCLQESNTKWESFLGTSPIGQQIHFLYPSSRFYNPPGNPWGGFAIFSKHRIHDLKVLKETDRGWYPAGLVTLEVVNKSQTAGTVDKGVNDMLQVLIVHLRAPVEWSLEPYWWGGHANWIGGYFSKRVIAARLNEIGTFARELNPDLPSIIVGDFNERSFSSPCLKYLETEMCMKNTPKRACAGFGCHANNTWKFEILGVPLLSFDYDHIVYASNYLELSNGTAIVHKDSGSDHRMVSAEFQFKRE